jgi:hypothetical protein
MNIGIGFILEAKTAAFKAGLATANNGLKDLKKSMREFNVGNGLSNLIGIGGVIAGFRTAITHAQELRDNLEQLGKPVDDATRSVAALGDSLSKVWEGAKTGGSWLLSLVTRSGEGLGMIVNRLRGISAEEEKRREDSARAADKLEAERDEKQKNRKKIQGDLDRKADDRAQEELERRNASEQQLYNNTIAKIMEAAKKERERIEIGKEINKQHAIELAIAEQKVIAAKKLADFEFSRLASEGASAAMQGDSTYLVDGKNYSSRARNEAQFAQASDAELQAIIAKNKRAAAEIEAGKGKGPSALAESVSGYVVRGMVQSVLETEIMRAQYQLSQRNGLRRDFSVGGESRARANFQGDPLQFDRLFQQFVQGQSVAQESNQALKDIRNALTRTGIITVPLGGV